MRFVSAVLLVIALAGCASPSQVDPLASELQGQPVCCGNRASELKPARLESDKELAISIGRGESVLELHSGKSYVKAIELPPDALGQVLEIRTFLVSGSHVLGPVVQFQDGARANVAKENSLRLYRSSRAFEPVSWLGLAVIPQGARYALVYTKPELFNQPLAFASSDAPVPVASTSSLLLSPSGSRPRPTAYGPTGELRVRLVRP